MYPIDLTPEAFEDLSALRRFDQSRVVESMEIQLCHEPAKETRNRKRLRPNELAEWELRVDNLRVFYDVRADPGTVKVIAIGVKIGSDLYIRGKRYEL